MATNRCPARHINTRRVKCITKRDGLSSIHIMYLFLTLSTFLFMLMRQKNYSRRGISNRFLKFREGRLPADSYFHNYAKLSEDEAINTATSL